MKQRSSLPATEQRNPRSRGLDRKSTTQILRIINREDARVPAAVGRAIPQIARAVHTITRALRRGGRLFYVGAGTSGRLAVLDASECPPTFGVSPRLIQGVIAGGRRALTHAVEGAEDDTAQGARDLASRKPDARDVVVGLTASGTTPYVIGALRYARRHGAATISVTSNPRGPVVRAARIRIVVETGPEVLTGSTRMKAGTAQKLVLNMLSTAVMVRLGHVYDNWMINVARTNNKLWRRAARILEQATGATASQAQHALRQAGHDPRIALLMLQAKLSANQARHRLRSAGGNLRRALNQ